MAKLQDVGMTYNTSSINTDSNMPACMKIKVTGSAVPDLGGESNGYVSSSVVAGSE